MQTGKVYRNLAVVQQKMYSYLTRFKTSLFTLRFFYSLRRRRLHHVVCLRAPTILDPPLGTRATFAYHSF